MIDFGIARWTLVGVAGDHAWFTHDRERKTLAVDLSTWPGKVSPRRDEWTCAVGGGVRLVGSTAQTVIDGKRALRLPSAGFVAIGVSAGRIVVVPGDAPAPLVYDDDWTALPCTRGDDPSTSAVVGKFVIWHGAVCRDGARLDDVRDASCFVATDDGFSCAAGGKLVIFTRDGVQREDRVIPSVPVATIARYDGALLVGDGARYWRYDIHARTCEAIDLGVPVVPKTLIAAACGLVALVEHGRKLVRLR